MGGAAVGVNAQHLAGGRGQVLRPVRFLGVAHRDVELTIGAEPETAAIVVPCSGNPVQDHPVVNSRAVNVGEPRHPVEKPAPVIPIGIADEQVAVLGETGVQGDAHQSCFGDVGHVQDGEWRIKERAILDHTYPPRTLGDQDAPVRGEGQRPRHFQSFGHHLDGDGRRFGCGRVRLSGGRLCSLDRQTPGRDQWSRGHQGAGRFQTSRSRQIAGCSQALRGRKAARGYQGLRRGQALWRRQAAGGSQRLYHLAQPLGCVSGVVGDTRYKEQAEA